MDLGAGHLAIHDTNAAQAGALVANLVQHFGPGRAALVGDLAAAMAMADGVVNTTPVGMSGLPGVSAIPLDALADRHWVADVIYTPIETPLIKAAAALGCRVLPGGGMAVQQAVDAFGLFTGREPDNARMTATFAAALAARDAI